MSRQRPTTTRRAARQSMVAPAGDPEQAQAVSLLRCVLDEVLSDQRFLIQKSISAIELAEHILARAAIGERDVARLKASAFRKLGIEN